MSPIQEIEMAIKAYARGLKSETETLDHIRDIVDPDPDTCPILDVFGLGPSLDPEAYGLPPRGWGR